VYQGGLIGKFMLYYAEPHEFTALEILVAQAIANHIAFAIARQRNAQRRAFLAEAGRVLAGSLDYEATLASIARLAVPDLADWCVVLMREPGDWLEPLAIAHRDPETARTGACPLAAFIPSIRMRVLAYRRCCGRANPSWCRRSQTSLLVAAAYEPEHLDVMRGQGLKIVHRRAALPCAAWCCWACLLFMSAESGRRYTPDDLALAEALPSVPALCHRQRLALQRGRARASGSRARRGTAPRVCRP
jgi:hypothetical protein